MENIVFPSFIAGLIAATLIRANSKRNDIQLLIPPTTDIKIISPKDQKVIILYGTTTGTSKSFANLLVRHLNAKFKGQFSLKNLDLFDDADLEKQDIALIICSTWENGEPPQKARRFYNWLQDYANDFRVSKNHLEHLSYSILGLGGKIYGPNFCKAVLEMDEYLNRLGATCLRTTVTADDASDLEKAFESWQEEIDALFSVHLPIKDTYKPHTEEEKINKINTCTNHQSSDNNTSKIKSLNKVQSSCCQSESNSTTTQIACCQSSHPHPQQSTYASSVLEDELEEEDIINNTFVTYDLVSDDEDEDKNGDQYYETDDEEREEEEEEDEDKLFKSNRSGIDTNNMNIGGCGEGDESNIDLEDLGAAISSHRVNTAANTGVNATNTTNNNNNNSNANSRPMNHNSLIPTMNKSQSVQSPRADDDSTSVVTTNTNTTTTIHTNKTSHIPKYTYKGLKKKLVTPVGGMTQPAPGEPREMVTKLQRKALVKEGYRIIGSHSAVKLCRWTKAQMRGRGGCYKHTFYGITSYQCMEATPSLACANKCVFCWRHHKNPVGTEWRWKTDDPSQIVEDAIILHRSMIHEMKGVPGVLPERLLEADTVRHCALSLVGEPIMYPRINEFIQELHMRQISTFLVTNAQFPECIRNLDPVTQLYVSIDAATKDSLKAIDRPLFKDFWERYIASLKALHMKKQRTVYRMTLVKDWNMNDMDGYLELIEMGQPDLIEIKGVTFCGKSDASSLTMENCPWHYEVCAYCELLISKLNARKKGPEYQIATEHEHSVCILIARVDKYYKNGQWYTWINYPKFYELIMKYYTSNKTCTFTSEDYMEITPSWSLYKSKEHGFDPIDNRYRKIKNGKIVKEEYIPTESGCG